MNFSDQESHIIIPENSGNLLNMTATILPEEEILGATLTTTYYSILGIQVPNGLSCIWYDTDLKKNSNKKKI